MVYLKIDNLTYMFYDKSVDYVLRKFNLWDIRNSFNHRIMHNVQGMSKVRALDASGILMFVSNDFYNIPVGDLYKMSSDEIALYRKYIADFYTAPCKEIRIEFQGVGMQTLINRDVINKTDINKRLFDRSYLGEYGRDYRLKRCDFAFDFVNHQPEFLDQFLSWCFENNQRLIMQRAICGKRGGFSLEYKGGNQKCIYIGSTNSEKYLRIYDKLLKECPNGVWRTSMPNEFEREPDDIKSWYRFELQTREKSPNSLPHDYLYNCNGDLYSVLKEVFNYFTICDFETKEPLDCIKNLYDVSKLPRIIQNLYYGYYKNVLISCDYYVKGTASKAITTKIAAGGLFEFLQDMDSNLLAMQIQDDDSSKNKSTRLFNQLDIVCSDNNLKRDYSQLPGIIKKGNYWRFNFEDCYIKLGEYLKKGDL